MKGFQNQDIGLFTFYRQQAEHEQQIRILKQQRALKKKLKKQQQQEKRRQREKEKEKQQQDLKKLSQNLKSINSSPSVPTQAASIQLKKDFIQRTKKYIKQLQSFGHNKLIHNQRKMQKRYSNRETQGNEGKEDRSQMFVKYEELNDKQKLGQQALMQSQQIFAKKKDIAKFNYFQLLNKQALSPKQFNSIQIFQINNPPQMHRFKQIAESLRRKGVQTQLKGSSPKLQLKLDRLQKLPKISPQHKNSNSARQSVPLPQMQQKTKHKKSSMHYNPIDIILNNEKYQIHQMQKSNRIHGKQDETMLANLHGLGHGHGHSNSVSIAKASSNYNFTNQRDNAIISFIRKNRVK